MTDKELDNYFAESLNQYFEKFLNKNKDIISELKLPQEILRNVYVEGAYTAALILTKVAKNKKD